MPHTKNTIQPDNSRRKREKNYTLRNPLLEEGIIKEGQDELGRDRGSLRVCPSDARVMRDKAYTLISEDLPEIKTDG